MDQDRREFIKTACLLSGLGCIHLQETAAVFNGLVGLTLPEHKDTAGTKLSLHEASYYKKLDDQMVQCHICPRECKVAKQERGYCGVRVNYDGVYYTLVHSRACSVHIDPIEKKPLYHFMPRSLAFSMATAGCNMMCKFCQNWQISQVRPEQVKNIVLTPDTIISTCKQKGVQSVAFTYSEPVIFYEYMYDVAKLGAEKGVKSVMISNGYIQKEPMQDLAQHLTAVKVDFKAYTEKFYSEVCAGHLKPVLETLTTLRDLKIWFELVYLMIPTLNDNLDNIREMCQWIHDQLGSDVPLHFSRFHPQYQLVNLPPTPISKMNAARDIARKAGINYVYLGNIPRHEAENTFCPNCHKLLIKRQGFFVLDNNISVKGEKGFCPSCNTQIPGVWI